jgi:hypothetical protein
MRLIWKVAYTPAAVCTAAVSVAQIAAIVAAQS